MRVPWLFVFAFTIVVVCGFEPQLSKENPNIDTEDYEGKTAWVEDLPIVQFGSFASSMCVDSETGSLIEAIYDNPGVIRIDKDVSGSPLTTALPGLPYPSSVVCDGSRTAFVASSVSPSAVAAVALSSDGSRLLRKSPITPLDVLCGGVLVLKYSSKLDKLVASCGMPPASILLIDIDRSDPEEYLLSARNRTFLDGSSGRSPWGLAVYESGGASFALVGLASGALVKVALPSLALVERLPTGANNLGLFSMGNNAQTLLMFSPFPWRRVLVLHLDTEYLALSELLSVALDQDLEFVIDLFIEPTTAMAYVVGNSQRKLPAVLQLDANHPADVWGIVLAGLCQKESGFAAASRAAVRRAGRAVPEAFAAFAAAPAPRPRLSEAERRKGGAVGGGGGARGGGGTFGGGAKASGAVAPTFSSGSVGRTSSVVGGGHNPVLSGGTVDGAKYRYWCEWGPKGRTARAVAFHIHPQRAPRMYIGVSAKYCAHCNDWEDETAKRCKDGKEAEDYYDDKTYCLHEEWNQRQITYGGNLSVGEVDVLSNMAWGGDNSSTIVMQLGAIPKIGGVAAASALAPWLHSVFLSSLAATAILLQARSL